MPKKTNVSIIKSTEMDCSLRSPTTSSYGIEISAVTSANSIVLREIAVLELLSWGREPTDIEVEERAKRLEEEIMAREPGEIGILVAKRSGAIVGFCQVAQDRNDTSQWGLRGLCVHPNHRRQGIGSALVRACIAYAQESGATIIRSATHLSNKVSIRFHESFGFKNEGRFTASDGDKKVAFSLTLG
jgi:ribosomal-protein-alanine N-acetyltransferase